MPEGSVLACWNFLMAAMVRGPMRPSIGPGSQPRDLRDSWINATWARSCGLGSTWGRWGCGGYGIGFGGRFFQRSRIALMVVLLVKSSRDRVGETYQLFAGGLSTASAAELPEPTTFVQKSRISL